MSSGDKPNPYLNALAASQAESEVVAEPPTVAEGLDLVGILSAIQETAYSWDLVSDCIDWESNAVAVLGVSKDGDIATGASYQNLIAPEHVANRFNTIPNASPSIGARGVAYRLQYRLIPGGGRSEQSIWIEDHGRWWPDGSGKPAHARGVVRVVSDRYFEEQRLLHRSDEDELTGQLNRIRLSEALAATMSRAERSGKPLAFLMASVNNLDVINETFGFDIGDEVIGAIARQIKSKLRGGDTLGRYSSNKFGVILTDCGPGAMRIAAERFMRAVRDTTIKTSACQLSATISVGGLSIDSSMALHDVVGNALQALDRAKIKRFDSFMAYEGDPARSTSRRRNIKIADEVISALDEQRMLLVLQPIVSAKTGMPEHYECLLRLQRPDGTLVSAGEFMTVVEQLGLSRLVDRRTLELSIALVKRHPELRLAVNVSGLTAGDHDWIVALHRLSGGKRSITNRLTIEITETAAVHDVDQTVIFVDTLREIGCQVAIDDFGAGYTSFKNLKVLNVDMVKIDGAFVKDLAKDQSGEVFIRTMIEIAQTFGMETVAEWVGDQETADFLIKAGITYLQGFHYGQPLTIEQYEAQQAEAKTAASAGHA